MSDPVVRPAAEADLAGIAAVSSATGQPAIGSGADPAYVALLLEGGRVRVAVHGDTEVVGWGATWPTPAGEVLSDLFVDPGWHGRGVGRRLLRDLWPQPPGTPGRLTFSSRHPSALPLYASAGLQPIWPLLYLSGNPRDLPASEAVRAEVTTAEAAARAEADLLGAAGRAATFAYWSRESTGAAIVVHHGADVVAAGAGSAAELAHLTYAGAPEHASAVLVAALQALAGETLGVCLPGPHPALAPLLARGWRIDDYDLAMSTPGLSLSPLWAYSPGLA